LFTSEGDLTEIGEAIVESRPGRASFSSILISFPCLELGGGGFFFAVAGELVTGAMGLARSS
jgi:hypothetical protein